MNGMAYKNKSLREDTDFEISYTIHFGHFFHVVVFLKQYFKLKCKLTLPSKSHVIRKMDRQMSNNIIS